MGHPTGDWGEGLLKKINTKCPYRIKLFFDENQIFFVGHPIFGGWIGEKITSYCPLNIIIIIFLRGPPAWWGGGAKTITSYCILDMIDFGEFFLTPYWSGVNNIPDSENIAQI